NDLGATAVTLSDSSGFIHDPAGINNEKLEWVKELKNERHGRIHEYADHFTGVTFVPADPQADHNPLWAISADCAFPSATENEINGKDAANLLNGGVFVVCEGTNMPTMPDGVEQFVKAGILYGPGKAANAGGVAVSGLEMTHARSVSGDRTPLLREQATRTLGHHLSIPPSFGESRGHQQRPHREVGRSGFHPGPVALHQDGRGPVRGAGGLGAGVAVRAGLLR